MIPGVNDVALSVPDMDRALAFYCGLLGFEKLSDHMAGHQGVYHIGEV